jgi:hypothetical protein
MNLRTALGDDTAEFVEGLIGEADAVEAGAQRRAKWWLTNIALCSNVTKLRRYVEKINKADIRFLRTAPNSLCKSKRYRGSFKRWPLRLRIGRTKGDQTCDAGQGR